MYVANRGTFLILEFCIFTLAKHCRVTVFSPGINLSFHLPLPCQALSERLFYYIAVSLLPHDTLCELEAAVEAGRALSPILQWHKHPNDYFSREAQTLYFNSLRTYWQELIDLTR